MQNVEPISKGLHFAVSMIVGAGLAFIMWILFVLLFEQFENGQFGAFEDYVGFLFLIGMLSVLAGCVAGGVYSYRTRRD